ncbi:hypothetical protein Patl1_06212 [Pistacia atlantica]|uniref:Uncharacterized protein n=1 Tax=Pistacia atlantica TaxID=434234 RepID=A0ACC1BT34_9ROSI|nr:hypothetical protein Patl1_06212 [Pistacia atlantica]
MLSFLKKRSTHNILFIFILSIIITIFPLTKANQPLNQTSLISQGNICSYSIEIETSCAAAAETTDHISVRFSDSAGNLIIVKHLKNPKLLYAPKNGGKKQGGGLQRCSINMFNANGACMKKSVCALYVKRVGSDEWRPGWIKVVHQEENGRAVPVSYTFYFRKFVPENVWFGFDYCHSRVGFKPHGG